MTHIFMRVIKHVSLMMLFLTPVSGWASSVTYNYQGNDFELIQAGVPAGVNAITVSMDLSELLAPDLVDSSVSPVSWTISDGYSTFSNLAWTDNSNFIFSTDSAGSITNWNVVISRAASAPAAGQARSVSTTSDSGGLADAAIYCQSGGAL